MVVKRATIIDVPDVFVGSVAVAEGLLTEPQLRGRSVRRVLHGVYRPAWVEVTHELRCRAAMLLLPDAARLTGRSAAATQGVDLARTMDDVEVVMPFGSRAPRIRGVSVRQTMSPGPLGPELEGLRLAHPVRVGYDLAARRPLTRATAYLDAACRAGVVDLERMQEWVCGCHDNDVVGVRAALAECDPRAESVPESEMRVILRQAGFPVVVQHVIRDGGRRIMRADLALPELRIAILYDGAWHALRAQLEHDRAQQRALQRAGWLSVHVTADLLGTPSSLVGAVAGAVAQRSH